MFIMRGKNMENIYKETMFILKKYNIAASKSLGQNFLIDDNVVEKIVNSAEIDKEDLIIEIGPGLGTLTKEMIDKVIAVELDKRMLQILNERFKLYNNFEVINEDILKVNLNEIIEREKNTQNIKNVKVVANLPYYITTPIIMKLLEDKLDIKTITVMVQKEVAKRLTANPGKSKDSGAITYSVNYYCEAQEVVTVPNTSFIPEPEVESEVIKLTLRNKPPIEVEDKELFFKLIKLSFMQRRKTLINGISNGNLMDKDKFRQVLNKIGLPENVRGENLTMQDFANIAKELQ